MTIWMLYTAWALTIASGLLLRLFIGPRCAHAWELVDKTEFQSINEESKRLGITLSNLTGLDTIEAVFRKKVVLVMRCPRCGAARVMNLEK